jgi:hypothetical protein
MGLSVRQPNAFGFRRPCSCGDDGAELAAAERAFLRA